MDKNTLLEKVWNAGHFWNPANPDGFNVDRDSLLKLEFDHPVVKEAVRSWQASDANYEIFCALDRARKGITTVLRDFPYHGELNDPTISLMNLKRCPIPDFVPPEGVKLFGGQAPEIERVIETMREFAATGSGSWPAPGCDPDLPADRKGFHSIIVKIDITNAPSRFKEGDYAQKSLDAVSAAYAEIGLLVRYDIQNKVSKPQIDKRFQNLVGSVIGWNEFPPSGTCNATINGRLDTGYVPTDYRLWANLECHETGHGVGLSHTRGHIMNPSILLVWPLSWKGGPSEAALRRYFGGDPIPPVNVIDWTDFFTG